jgi:DNA-binding LytR/AlgR family response regulator
VTRSIRAVVVDDEELARRRVRELLAGIPDVTCVGEAENGIEAVERIRALEPDVVFLDIQMPGMNGFEVLAALERVPLVVFATAYDEYAIRAFDVNSVDYLLKPIERERLEQAVARVRNALGGGKELGRELSRIAGLLAGQGADRLPVTKGRRIVLLKLDDIVWVGASEGLVFVHTRDGVFLANMTMADLESRLDERLFFRVHRSTIVNLNHVVEIVPWFSGKYKIVVDDNDRTELVLSRSRAKDLRRIFPW